jgi:1-acyl-sn-glycerol-3-phosphate acyltransferase
VPQARPDNRVYRFVARIVRTILFLITRRDWRGQENLPKTGGFIVAVNHMSHMDPLTFAHYVWDSGYAPRMFAKSSLWKVPVIGWLAQRTGQIPVARGTSGAARSLVVAADLLHQGECVAIFPEGTLTREPNLWPMSGKTGVARLALTSRAPVIPVAPWGAPNLLGWYSKVFKPIPPKRITVVAGPPVDLSDLYDRPQDAEVLREATERVMAAITTMLEDIRGEKAPAVRSVWRRTESS